MKKRFLHICLSEGWGGLEMAVSKWNEVLQENGHENLNLCTPESPLAQDLKMKALPLIEWDSALYFAPDFTWKLRQLVQSKAFDFVILQNLRDLWIVSPALINCPQVQLIGFAQMLLGIKKTDPLHRLVYSRLNYLMTLTDWQVEALRPCLPVPRHKYRTIPNFVDTRQFHPGHRSDGFRYQMGFKSEDFVIGVIGRIDEQKGQLELVQAFRQISDKYNSTHLMIIGEPTTGEPEQEQYFAEIKKQVAAERLEKRVHFKGFQRDTRKLFANFDLFVLPSHQETFGFVVVEAMASGTPVLATQAGGVPEILQEGQCGFLCQPKSAESLREQLEFILENTEARQEKTERALQRARDFYDRQAVYERFIKILSDPQ
jgi:glycosyltransferase involved in cell wall biosynthesis